MCVGVSPIYKDFFLPSRTYDPAVVLAAPLPLSSSPTGSEAFIPSCEHPGFCDVLSGDTQHSGVERDLTGKIKTVEKIGDPFGAW